MAQTAVEGEVRLGAGAPATAENESQKPPSQEAALLEELRRFVRHTTHQPEPPEEKPPAPKRAGRLQLAVLVVVVLDVVLLYPEFQEWFENPLFRMALKVLPWLLGATAFAYSDKVRDWILALCQRKWVAVIAVLVALPLLILRQRVFSIVVNVDSDSVFVESADAKP